MNMNWLKTLGQVALKFTAVVIGIVPFAASALAAVGGSTGTAIADDLTVVASTIQQVEAVGASASLSGPQKLAAAAPIVDKVLQGWMARNGNVKVKVADADAYVTAVNNWTSAFVDILNSLDVQPASAPPSA